MFDFLKDISSYEERVVDHTEIDGDTIIDTCAVSDGKQPYETAISSSKYNNGNWVIVEAYDNKEEAQSGHNRWVGVFSSDELPTKLTDCNNANVAQFGKLLFPDEWEDDFLEEF